MFSIIAIIMDAIMKDILNLTTQFSLATSPSLPSYTYLQA
jgi:hypothetical protein